MKRMDVKVVLSSILLVFSSMKLVHSSVIVTDAIGTQEEWVFEETLGVQNLINRVNQVDGKGVTQTWDNNNNKLSKVDAEGQVTTYTYNATNQRTSMTEASGTNKARTTTYEYVSSDVDIITKTTTPSIYASNDKVVINTYDTQLNAIKTEINGFNSDGLSVNRTMKFDYDSLGNIVEVDGYRNDVDDITTFTYYNCATGAECGQLKTVTNALGHVTTYNSYDANARLVKMTSASGVVTTNKYHPRGWLLSRTQTAPNGDQRITSYEYDADGLMTQFIAPDGLLISYEYDSAHDLRAISDNVKNRVEYTYDEKGNRNVERIVDPNGALVREIHTAYDIRNFIESINVSGSVTQMINDAVGKLTTQTDPNLNPSAVNEYDSLYRLTGVIDALSNNTSYEYNIADQLTKVTAPNGAVTEYFYDDLDNLLREVSPDRGVITYTHDNAGNVLSQADARGVKTTYQYDALNRLLSVNYPNTSENITYLYDTAGMGISIGENTCHQTNEAFAVGRLCQISDEAGLTNYQYDVWGNVTQHKRLELEQVYLTQYRYDKANRVTKMIYPSGRTVNYQRDVLGRLLSMNSIALDGQQTDVLTHRTYRADGVWIEQSYGNGLIQTKQYDTQGRLESHTAGDYNRDYGYDANGNILDIQGGLDNLYKYDSLDRLIENTVSDLGIYRSWDYDPNGNRIELVDADITNTLGYQANSNRLMTFDARAVTLDASGRTVNDLEGRYYEYNDAGRLAMLREEGLAKKVIGQYYYNAMQLRTRKTIGKKTTVYHYDLAGNLLAEGDEQGEINSEYLYADGERVAIFNKELVSGNVVVPTLPSSMRPIDRETAKKILPIIILHLLDDDGEASTALKPELPVTLPPVQSYQWNVHYYINDHLQTPQRLMDESNQISWGADYEAFGQATITTETIEQNHRFPGQYYDAESGLHYNWNRYYDAKIGRYLTSDPIGLGGGFNTFGYVSGNPLIFSDPFGLIKTGEWLITPHLVEDSLSAPYSGREWIFGVDKYLSILLVKLNFDASGNIRAKARCTDECGDVEDMFYEGRQSEEASIKLGPNIIASLGGVFYGFVVSVTLNSIVIDLKLNEGLQTISHGLKQKAEILNQYGATAVCNYGWPTI